MSALTPGDQRRLQSTLARLASPHDGEIVAAAAAAQRILEKAGLRFTDLAPPAEPPLHCERDNAPSCDHQARAERLLLSGHAWSRWAEGFLAEIGTWRTPLSDRQAKILAELEAEAGLDQAA